MNWITENVKENEQNKLREKLKSLKNIDNKSKKVIEKINLITTTLDRVKDLKKKVAASRNKYKTN